MKLIEAPSPNHDSRDGRAIDDGAVDDAVGRHGLGAVRGDAVAFASRLQLDRLDGARTNVESDDRSALVEQRKIPHSGALPMGKPGATGARQITYENRRYRCLVITLL